LTRASIIFTQKMDCRVKPGNDDQCDIRVLINLIRLATEHEHGINQIMQAAGAHMDHPPSLVGYYKYDNAQAEHPELLSRVRRWEGARCSPSRPRS
jgi:hypothetical protein